MFVPLIGIYDVIFNILCCFLNSGAASFLFPFTFTSTNHSCFFLFCFSSSSSSSFSTFVTCFLSCAMYVARHAYIENTAHRTQHEIQNTLNNGSFLWELFDCLSSISFVFGTVSFSLFVTTDTFSYWTLLFNLSTRILSLTMSMSECVYGIRSFHSRLLDRYHLFGLYHNAVVCEPLKSEKPWPSDHKTAPKPLFAHALNWIDNKKEIDNTYRGKSRRTTRKNMRRMGSENIILGNEYVIYLFDCALKAHITFISHVIIFYLPSPFFGSLSVPFHLVSLYPPHPLLAIRACISHTTDTIRFVFRLDCLSCECFYWDELGKNHKFVGIHNCT